MEFFAVIVCGNTAVAAVPAAGVVVTPADVANAVAAITLFTHWATDSVAA